MRMGGRRMDVRLQNFNRRVPPKTWTACENLSRQQTLLEKIMVGREVLPANEKNPNSRTVAPLKQQGLPRCKSPRTTPDFRESDKQTKATLVRPMMVDCAERSYTGCA